MDSTLHLCVICKKNNNDEPGVKKYKSLDAVRRAAERRRSLTSDKFATATRDILAAESSCDLYYHTSCNSKFCAVKRKAPVDDNQSQSLPPNVKSTRSKSDLPHSDATGVLEHSCIFCSAERKRLSSGDSSFEKLHKVETTELSIVLISAAKGSPGLRSSQRVLALGSEDLVAIEAKYHNSCRVNFIKETQKTETNDTQMNVCNRIKHEKAFEDFMPYIEQEIIQSRIPKYASKLIDLYKEQYIAKWGRDEDIASYLSQNFIRKVKNKFGERLVVDKISNKDGNFLYPRGMSLDEAKSRLNNLNVREDQVRCAALVLRSEILEMEKTKMPSPTTIQTLKERAPAIPPLTQLFFQTLTSGLAATPGESSQRKSMSMASDALFTTSRGNVRPWKHTSLGLGLSSMLGSKTAVTILNRLGHTVSYDECKRLETEIAYTCSSGDHETPTGLILKPSLATGTAWDNYDLNMDTLNGKDSLHVTVGIAYQNVTQKQNVDDNAVYHEQRPEPTCSVAGRPRRSFEGTDKPISPFRTNLKLAKFHFKESEQDKLGESDIGYVLTRATHIDFMWLVVSRTEQLPLFNGFYSLFVNDPLPLTSVAYLDPISQPPTRNDVVQETMYRSLKVADENNMPYHPVTYDLAVASKALSIQALRSPMFDRLIILLGHFHVELAFFGAIGTYISDSGLEYILTEANVLAEGSLNGFIHGKLYNRCTRVHQIAAVTLEKALFERFLITASDDEREVLESVSTLPKGDTEAQRKLADSEGFQKLSTAYEDFLHRTIRGDLGENASFWAVYVYLINRVYREIQRAVKTNDVELYLKVLPSVIEIFFSLNRPNYARWGSYFLEKLNNLDPEAIDILRAGAFSVRRTKNAYSRSPIDLTVEQTVNRHAASSAGGITHFASSDGAFRRWCCTLSQRSMAVTEMTDMSGIEHGETSAKQLRGWRIDRDNADIDRLSRVLHNTCDPFTNEAPGILVNIATGKAAPHTTGKYLLGTLERGAKLRQEFRSQCVADDGRFLKPVKRVKVQNFAASNIKRKPSREKRALGAAEGVRDAFGYLLSKTGIDLHDVLVFPITEVPLSFAHADGTPTKTEKANLTKVLEKRQSPTDQDESTQPATDATLFDGGLILHEVLPAHKTSTYGRIVSDIMLKVCSASGNYIHLLLDKYVEPSIKDIERLNRGATQCENNSYVITGAEQQQHRKGVDLLKNGAFKDALAQFILTEIRKEYYAPVIGNKTVYVSHGGTCLKLRVNSMGMLVVDQPNEFQAHHEEADTLLAFHTYRSSGRIMVRSSDTDVLVILIGLATRMPETSTILMDFGSANNRRIINVTDISRQLEDKQTGLSEALIGFHALTGCDFNSAFYGKGKAIPYSYMEKDINHVAALRSLCGDIVDIPAITAFVCRIYGFKGLSDIDEARYQSFIKMTHGKGKAVQSKKINCASLPPCRKTLAQHLSRANYIAIMWRLAHTPEPTKDIHPLNFGWTDRDGHYVPNWFEGEPLPERLLENEDSEQAEFHEDSLDTVSDLGMNPFDDETDENLKDNQPWSDDSDSDCDDVD